MWKLKQRLFQWFDERSGLSQVWQATACHPTPPQTGWMYVFGSATLVALIVQILTGIALASHYIPSTNEAYISLQALSQYPSTGYLLRGMHYWGASAMVLLMILHMTRVFLTASYKFPRELNWITGVLLLSFTLAIAFTGQLMRWDNNAVWSIIVAANQAARLPLIGQEAAQLVLGGQTLGAKTLSSLFVIHVFVLPALILGTLGFHLYLVIRNGISEPPIQGNMVKKAEYRQRYQEMLKKSGVPFWPNAAWRDAVFSVAILMMITLLAWLIGPPQLGEAPNPTLLDLSPRPDWYFLWYFAILALSPHQLENYIMILAPLVGIILLLLLPIFFNEGHRHPKQRPLAIAVVLVLWTSIISLSVAGHQSNWSPRFDTNALTPQIVGRESGNIWEGSQLFRERGCQYCHQIEGVGGKRGPDLSTIGSRLTEEQLIIRINNGGYNMPAYAASLSSEDLDKIVDFLQSRRK